MVDPRPQSDERRPGIRVLVVDDCQDTARMMRMLLRGQGHDVKVALTGREAIAVAAAFLPEILLVDLSLPDISGAEVAETLRATEGLGRSTFVAVSGYGSERIPTVFDRHFVKPVDYDALLSLLSSP